MDKIKLLILPGDGIGPEAVDEVKKIIDFLNKYDFVIGSRYTEGGKNVQPVFRYLISYLGNKLIKV